MTTPQFTIRFNEKMPEEVYQWLKNHAPFLVNGEPAPISNVPLNVVPYGADDDLFFKMHQMRSLLCEFNPQEWCDTLHNAMLRIETAEKKHER